jgi:hypothetical protein
MSKEMDMHSNSTVGDFVPPDPSLFLQKVFEVFDSAETYPKLHVIKFKNKSS